MKTTVSLLLIAALSPAIMLLASCTKTNKVDQAVQSTKAAVKELAADVKAAVSDSWDSIKDYTYEKREDFAASLDRMADKRDAEIKEMNAKLTGLPDAAAKERDRAVKEYNEARAYLKSKLAELRTGTADTWADAKEKATEAWKRTQAAYEKVKASPTS
jgi:outer membrane murein-binding lipoprotein Lpp